MNAFSLATFGQKTHKIQGGHLFTGARTISHFILRIEWPTFLLIIATYAAWYLLITSHAQINSALWIVLTGFVVTLFLSITHEVTHRHPTRSGFINGMLILLPVGWVMPYERFRDTHIAHHETGELTDPFDDPESWYLNRFEWQSMPVAFRKILEFNNTLAGRMLIGPVLGLGRFYVQELRLIMTDQTQRSYLVSVWLKHILLCALLAWIASEVSFWMLAGSTYLGVSLLMVRSFLEHQASPDLRERTVIIERNCPLAFLFLFNNLHVVHHDRPGIPWYKLRNEYIANREHYICLNNGYLYESYWQVFRRYFFRMKEPVLHPASEMETH
jgi:fatty acid desaturase